jgi:thiol-disulfide isomerase/thioredoxin
MKWAAFAILAAALAMGQPTRAADAPENLIVHEAPKPLPAIRFEDGEGHAQALGDFRNKLVLLNIWATWCVPCRREMVTLDRLQGDLGGADFQVIALSIDRGGAVAVRKFFSEIGVQRLTVHLDVAGEAFQALGVVGLPTTVLIDRQGREIGRLIGPSDWDAPEMVAFLKSVIVQQAGAVPATK